MKKLYYALLLFIASCSSAGTGADDGIILPVEEYAKAIATDTTAFILDVRTPEEYAEGHIEGAMLMNVLEEETFASGIDTLKSDHTYYIYCRSGRRSRKAASMMTQRGLKVVDLKGGYNAWKGR